MTHGAAELCLWTYGRLCGATLMLLVVHEKEPVIKALIFLMGKQRTVMFVFHICAVISLYHTTAYVLDSPHLPLGIFLLTSLD